MRCITGTCRCIIDTGAMSNSAIQFDDLITDSRLLCAQTMLNPERNPSLLNRVEPILYTVPLDMVSKYTR